MLQMIEHIGWAAAGVLVKQGDGVCVHVCEN